jgi:3,4-dihydroxy 2-butanone 4-phosphate synthase / GTP cyclohydrolase II
MHDDFADEIDFADLAEADLVTRRGTFRTVAFRDPVDGHEHLALIFGQIEPYKVLVRVHSECVTGDIFGAMRCECGDQLAAALDTIVEEGSGVLVYLRGHEGRGIGLVAKVRTHELQDDHGFDTVDSASVLGFPVDARDFSPAARVLRYLGVRSVRLMSNNPDKINALESNGIEVAARLPLLVGANDHNIRYLTTKRDRLGHDLPHLESLAGTSEAACFPPADRRRSAG